MGRIIPKKNILTKFETILFFHHQNIHYG